MDVALVIGFYVAVALLIIRVRQVSLALAALVLTGMLVLALIAEATVSSRLGGYAALGLVIAVVMLGLRSSLAMGYGGRRAGSGGIVRLLPLMARAASLRGAGSRSTRSKSMRSGSGELGETGE